MNLLRRAIAAAEVGSTLSSCRSSPRKWLLLGQHQLQHSSLYSSTTTSSANSGSRSQKKSTAGVSVSNRSRSQKQPAWSSSAEMVQKQAPKGSDDPHEVDSEKGLVRDKEPTLDWPRPSEIPWQAKVANTVNLIGHVQIPVQFEASPDGKCWAGTIISQPHEHCSDSPPFWIPIIFEGDLAHAAACHLKVKDYVYISGQLSADLPPFTMSQGQANVQVMARSINYVLVSSGSKKAFTPLKLEEWVNNNAAPDSLKNDISVNQLRKNLSVEPHMLRKGDAVVLAVDHKDNDKLCWSNERTQEQILTKLGSSTSGHKVVRDSLKKVSDSNFEDPALRPWKELLNNPANWQDNREKKLSGLLKPNYPDFKHKESGLGLWLNRAPKWVVSELDGQPPKVKQEKEFRGHDWKNLVENPDKWWDNRGKKMNVKSPDFKHKETGKPLWLSNCPDWLTSRLPPLKAVVSGSFGKRSKPLSSTL